MKRYILSIDGGGIRGIIPTIILSAIEKKINKPISQVFDLIVGTSTGGIISAGLCKKNNKNKAQYSAQNLMEIYKEHGSRIFRSSFLQKSLSWVYGPEYSDNHVEYVLDQYFADDTLNCSLKPLLLTTYDIYNNCPFFFKSWKKDRNFIKIRDALRAAIAAPTYFTPKHLKIKSQKRVLVDGGLFANNPSACAYSCARRIFSPTDKLVILSVGTGISEKGISYKEAKKFGKIPWIKPLLDTIFNSALDIVDYQLNEIMGKNYIRIQSQLKVASYSMDNSKKSNINNLIKEANLILQYNTKLIDNICNMLS